MSCASASWDAYLSESVLSTDGSKILSFFTYGSASNYMYFATFNKADGAVVGSRYKSSTPIDGIIGSAQKGDLIVLTVYDGSGIYYLAMLNSTSSAFKINSFAGAGLFGAAVLPNDVG